MPEVLSQSEIDELLKALSSGDPMDAAKEEENEQGTVRPYDFRTANKFSKEQIRTLSTVYEHFAQSMNNMLSGALRTICNVELLAVEERTFGEFTNSLPDPVIMGILQMPPLTGPCLIEITPAVAYGIVSHVFGGGDDITNPSKAFTEIELAAISRIVKQLMSRMGEAWSRVADVNPMLERLETSAQFAQIVSLNDTIAIITLNVTIGKISDFVNICIPQVALEPIAKQMSTKLWYSTNLSRDVVPQGERIRDRILRSQVVVQVSFAATTAYVSDLISLQVGDVIQLSHSVKSPLTVRVEHLDKFRGYIGTKGNKYALRISEVVKEEAEDE